MDKATAVLLGLLFVPAVYIVFSSRRKQSHRRSPPGPRPYPFFGNMFDMPKDQPWITYRDWSATYGSDIIFLHLPNQPTIVINSHAAATELLTRRSQNYSDRPLLIMDELMGWEWNLGVMGYTPEWRDRRKAFHRFFQEGVAERYRDVEQREIRAFLKRAVSFEKGIDTQSVNLTFVAIIVDIMYGVRIRDSHDKYVRLSQKATEGSSIGRVPGRFWVEYFPILRYIPAWVPGSSARKIGATYKPVVTATRHELFDRVQEQMAHGIAGSSVAHRLIQENEEEGIDRAAFALRDAVARDVTGLGYAAATETQGATASAFFNAMALFPEAQKKAQKELDSVLGPTRLPTIDDIASLPYLQAVLMEVMRWSPTAPLGVAHRCIEEDVYDGYFIPAGTAVYSNIWAILRDPSVYPDDPENFNPDRFILNGQLNPDVPRPDGFYGYGRRICVGRFLAQDIMQLMFASILYVYAIEPLAEGKTTMKFTTRHISSPESLPYRFKLRNPAALLTIDEDTL